MTRGGFTTWRRIPFHSELEQARGNSPEMAPFGLYNEIGAIRKSRAVRAYVTENSETVY
jgi:hypothetical protein